MMILGTIHLAIPRRGWFSGAFFVETGSNPAGISCIITADGERHSYGVFTGKFIWPLALYNTTANPPKMRQKA
jgi:hypothetical protein